MTAEYPRMITRGCNISAAFGKLLAMHISLQVPLTCLKLLVAFFGTVNNEYPLYSTSPSISASVRLSGRLRILCTFFSHQMSLHLTESFQGHGARITGSVPEYEPKHV